jgi:hypothetical protein
VKYQQIDYGNGVVRKFSPEQIQAFRLRYHTEGKDSFREATREWAESLPHDLQECKPHWFGKP